VVQAQTKNDDAVGSLASPAHDDCGTSSTETLKCNRDCNSVVPDPTCTADADEVLSLIASELHTCVMNDWLAHWCTPDIVQHYITACKGNKSKAAKHLAKTMEWRQKHKNILSGLRVPKWQGDMRVIAIGKTGHPLIFLSMSQQPKYTSASASIDHMIAVLETAVNLMRGQVTRFDVVCDCWGFDLKKNLDPRLAIAAFEMLRLPYKGRLRSGLLVDAPKSFGMLWRVVSRTMAESTKTKIGFANLQQAVHSVGEQAGHESAGIVSCALRCNRETTQNVNFKLPSEINNLPPNFGGAQP